MTATELRQALRTESSTVKAKGGTNIRFSLQFKNGLTKTYNLNIDGSWVLKPT